MFRRRKLIIIAVAVIAVFASALFIKSQYVVPILMYHSVRPGALPSNRLCVSADSFERQMRFLKVHKYNILPLEKVAGIIREKKKIPHKTVAVTFDDGFKDFYIYAFPVLKKYNIPATMFLIFNEIARPQSDRLNWDEIREMKDSGIITFGSHCLGPEPLINIRSEKVLKDEIFLSKIKLEQGLSKEVNSFSYPGGMFNEEIKQLVRQAGYKLAVTTNPGTKYPNDDIFALKRLRISFTSDNLFVFWLESGGFYNLIREHRHK
jgi:peptidoglycan/xylan/chitin deacetylase (PgdA/CDA1 family)